MALFFECMPQCARKVLDTADIVRDAMLRNLSECLFRLASRTIERIPRTMDCHKELTKMRPGRNTLFFSFS